MSQNQFGVTLPPSEGDRNLLIQRQEGHHLAGVSDAEDGPRYVLVRDSMELLRDGHIDG
jgi:hypothetical protein